MRNHNALVHLLALVEEDTKLYFFIDDQDRIVDSIFGADDDEAMAHAATLAAHREVFVARFVGSVEPIAQEIGAAP